MPAESPRLAFPVGEAAQIIGIGRTTLYAEIASGRVQTVTIGKRRLVTRQALEAYLAALSEAS